VRLDCDPGTYCCQHGTPRSSSRAVRIAARFVERRHVLPGTRRIRTRSAGRLIAGGSWVGGPSTARPSCRPHRSSWPGCGSRVRRAWRRRPRRVRGGSRPLTAVPGQAGCGRRASGLARA